MLPGVRDQFVFLPIVARRLVPGQPVPTATATATTTPGGPSPTPTATVTPGEVCANYVINGEFEQGLAPWQQHSSGGYDLVTTENAYQGAYGALLGGYDEADDRLWQMVEFPSGITSVTLTFFYNLQSNDSADMPYDFFVASILSSDRTRELVPMGGLDNTDVTAGWVPAQYIFGVSDLMAVAGQETALYFGMLTDEVEPTLIALDNVRLDVCTEQ